MQQGTYGAVAAFRDETGQEHPWMSQCWMGLLQSGNAHIKRYHIEMQQEDARGSLTRVVAHIEFTTWQLLWALFCSFCNISRGISAGFTSLIPYYPKSMLDSALWHALRIQRKEVAIKKIPNSWQNTTEAGASEPWIAERRNVVILQDIATFSGVFFWSRIWLES